MELHQAQLSTLVFLEHVKVYSKRNVMSINFNGWVHTEFCLWRGYIQQTDDEVACFKAEAICLDVTS